jgi:hypothetical protein
MPTQNRLPMPTSKQPPEATFLAAIKPLDDARWQLTLRKEGGGSELLTCPKDAIVGATWSRLRQAVEGISSRRLTVTPVKGYDGPEAYYEANLGLDKMQASPQDQQATTSSSGLTASFALDATTSPAGVSMARRRDLLAQTALGREIVQATDNQQKPR